MSGIQKPPSDEQSDRVFYLYLIDCDGRSLYTGITTDVQRRWREHLGQVSGGASFTRSGTVLDLVYAVEVGSRSLASKFEARIKRLSRAEKIHIVARQPDREELAALIGLELTDKD